MESPTIGKLAEALAKAQAEIQPAKFNRVNPHFKNRYADFTAVVEAAKPIHRHGLSYVQIPKQGFVTTKLMHSSGEWIEGDTPILLDKQTMQGMGSAISYAKRYGLSSMLSIPSDEDDDGNATEPKPVSGKKKEFDQYQDTTITVPAKNEDVVW